ncbi:hypothetical protein A4G99_02400 [Haladaptatus sp. R4]|nr:hypothetical protein A4G99_02400 [Haladaptatus sp. R4]
MLRNASQQPRTVDIRITRSGRELFSETYNVAPPASDDNTLGNSRTISAPIGERRADTVSVTIDSGEIHHIRYTESDPPESQCLRLSIRIEDGGQYRRFENPCET